jgi:hypothetical protein
MPAKTHQSASDNEPTELGTISISDSSRVSEVHGDHTLAPIGHGRNNLTAVYTLTLFYLAPTPITPHPHQVSRDVCTSSADCIKY